MGYTAPTTRATGYLVTAANWNTDLVDNITFLANPPQCRVYHNAAQSIAVSGTAQALTFNSERYDTDTMHDTATNPTRITFKTAGVYVVSAAAEYAANATGLRSLEFLVNGATFIAIDSRTSVGAGTSTYCTCQTTYKFAVNDYVEVRANQTSGGALNVNNFSQSSPEFAATWIGIG